ncbi:MAG: hypothetical protein R3E39_29780 [Anaerolineae bacterium]
MPLHWQAGSSHVVAELTELAGGSESVALQCRLCSGWLGHGCRSGEIDTCSAGTRKQALNGSTES